MIRSLAVIGVGLIGGSLARALRKHGACAEVVGAGRRRENLEKALALQVIDRYETDVGAAVEGCDMVLVAVPLGAMEAVFSAMRGRLAPDAVITDAGSAKRTVIAAARAAFGELPSAFVPGHPIAGTEKSGVGASFDTLFEGRRVILTPQPETEPAATARVRTMWETAGAVVEEMEAGHHDAVLAATSHLPHVLAFALVDLLGARDEHEEMFRYAAGGFRDFTRIASSDPQMWHDICLANGDALVEILERFGVELAGATEAIRTGDSEAVKSLFVRAKGYRDQYTSEANG